MNLPDYENPSPSPSPSPALGTNEPPPFSIPSEPGVDSGLDVSNPDGHDGIAPAPGQDFISPEIFAGAFRALLGAPNVALKSPLQSLIIADSDPGARAASDALYGICQDVPWLNFLVRPESLMMQRCIAIGAFAIPVAMGVRSELAARKSDKPKPVEMSEAPSPGTDLAQPTAAERVEVEHEGSTVDGVLSQ